MMNNAITIILTAILLAGCAGPKIWAGDYSNYYEKYYGEDRAEAIAEKVAAEEIRPEVPQHFPPPGVLLNITKEIAAPAQTVSQLEETCSWEGNYCVTTPTTQAAGDTIYQESLEPESKSFLGVVLEVLNMIPSGWGSGVFSGPIF